LSPKVTVTVLVLIGLLLAGGIAFAYYREEIAAFTSIHVWDRETPKQLVLQFVRNCHSDNGKAAWETLGRTNFAEPVYSGNRLTAVKSYGQGGLTTTRVEKWAPVGEVKTVEVEPRVRAGVGYFLVIVEYGNGKWGIFRVQRDQGALRIVKCPIVLSDQHPILLFGD